MVHLPKHSVGGGILLSILHTQRDAAANYICPVLMYPAACLSMVAADGVPSSDVREEGEAAEPFFSLWCEPQAGEGWCCGVPLSALVVLEGRTGVPLGSKQPGGRQPALQPRNEAYKVYLVASSRMGLEKSQVQFWSVWGLDEKEKFDKRTWKLI